MSDELTVHQDTTLHTGKLALVLPLAGVAALFGAGTIYGALSARLDRVERDVLERAPATEMQQGFRSIETRLVRIEQGLDRVLMIVPPAPRGTP
jgi:hypothetical protein